MTKKKTNVGGARTFEPGLLSVSEGAATEAVTQAGDQSADLVDAWVIAKNAAAVLAVAEDEKAPAPARKAARRGLNVLKARGIAIPDRRHVAKVSTVDEVEGYEAWFMPPDPTGAGVLFLAARTTSSKLKLVQVSFRDGVGLQEIRYLEASRSRLREMFAGIAGRAGFEPATVSVEWARTRVARAKADNAASGAILPLGLDSHQSILEPAPEVAPPHPIDLANLGLPEGSQGVAGSAELHGLRQFAGWLPGGPAVRDLLSDIGQKLAGPEGPEQDRAKIDAAMGSSIDAATDRFFTPDVRERIAAVMKDVAISVLQTEGRDAAALVMATAAASISAGLVTSPPHEIPFLRGFFQKALAMVAQQQGGQLNVPVPAPAPAQG